EAMSVREVHFGDDLCGSHPHDHLRGDCVATPVLVRTFVSHVASGDSRRPLEQLVGSVEVEARPATVTKVNGGRSSSQHNDTRGSRRIALPFTVSPDVMNTTSSPSRSIHTGAT